MATDIFTRAKAYRKKHPSTPWTDCVKACAKSPAKKVAAAVGRVHKKKKAPAKRKKAAAKKSAPKKTKVKIKFKKNMLPAVSIGKAKKKAKIGYPSKAKQWGRDKIHEESKKLGLRLKHGYEVEGRRGVHGIAGVSMDKVHQELLHQQALTASLNKHREMLKGKGQTATEKARIRREIDHYRNAIAASKKHVTALKRTI